MKRNSSAGHFLSKHELRTLCQEVAISLLHTLMTFYPVKLVTKEGMEKIPDTDKYSLIETGAPFLHLQTPLMKIPRMNTLAAAKDVFIALSGDILDHIKKNWSEKHGTSPVYLYQGPKVSVETKDDTFFATIEVILAGATLLEQEDNKRNLKAKKKLLLVS